MVATPLMVESFGRVSGAIGKSASVGKVIHPSEITQAIADNPKLASLGKIRTVSVAAADNSLNSVKLTIPEYNVYSLIEKGQITIERGFGYADNAVAARSMTRDIESNVKGNSYGFTKAVDAFGKDAVKGVYPKVNIDAMLKSEAALSDARQPSLLEANAVRNKLVAERMWDNAVGKRTATGEEATTLSGYSKDGFRAAFAKKGYILADPKTYS
jgi:hypothetical protein